MKLSISLLMCLFSVTAYSATSSRCPGEEGYYYTNFTIGNKEKYDSVLPMFEELLKACKM